MNVALVPSLFYPGTPISQKECIENQICFFHPANVTKKNHKTNVTKFRKIPKTNVTKIGKHVFNTQNECNENQAQNLQKTNVTKVLTPNSYVHKLSDFVTFVLCKSNFGFRYIRFVYNF